MRLNRFVSSSIVLFLSVCLSFSMAEIYLRLIHYPQEGCKDISDVSESRLAKFDPEIGWSYIPYKASVGDYGVIYKFNSEGYRSLTLDHKTDFTKPRILIIGDSSLFGHGLSFEDTFGYRLQQRLQNKYEVINFAVQAYGTDQMYLLLKRVFPIYKPEVVIMDYAEEHLARNVSEDRREILKCAKFIGTKPVFTRKNGQVVLKSIPKRYTAYDNPRIFLALRRLFSGSLSDRINRYGELITQALFREIKFYVESQGARLYVLDLGTPEEMSKKTNILGISIDMENGGRKNLYLTETDLHPNASGAAFMVDRFLDKYGKDF